MEPSHEVFENGPIRITRTLRSDQFVYTITLNDFAQMVLNRRAFTDLKELMIAFEEEDKLNEDISALVSQEQFQFDIQEGEYG